MQRQSRLPSPALVVAIVALIAALSGAAIALPGKGKVDSGDLKKGAVTKKAIKKGAVTKKAIKSGAVVTNGIKDGAVTEPKLADGAVTGAKVAAGSLDTGKLSDQAIIPLTRQTATSGATEAAARAAAPEVPLYSKGQLEMYGKCFIDTGTGDIFGEIIARTSANGAILDGADSLPSNDAELLDTDTPEEDRTVADEEATDPNVADYGDEEYDLASADGAVALTGVLGVAVKQGSLPGGNGVFGDGDVCLFHGNAVG